LCLCVTSSQNLVSASETAANINYSSAIASSPVLSVAHSFPGTLREYSSGEFVDNKQQGKRHDNGEGKSLPAKWRVAMKERDHSYDLFLPWCLLPQ
jgi:hypothetical protein